MDPPTLRSAHHASVYRSSHKLTLVVLLLLRAAPDTSGTVVIASKSTSATLSSIAKCGRRSALP